MKWLGKWLIKLTNNTRYNEGAQIAESVSAPRFGSPININVYNAHGGKIVTFHSYDKHNDRSRETTYIIHPDEQFAESLGKLIAMEEIKHDV